MKFSKNKYKILLFGWNLQLDLAQSGEPHFCLSLSKPCPPRLSRQREGTKSPVPALGNCCSFLP